MTDDDPVKRRAEEIRSEQAAAATAGAGRDTDLRSARLFFVQRFLDALTEQTPHALECVETAGGAHGAIARFSFLRDGKPWTLNIFEFGIDRVDGEVGSRRFLYYIDPTSAAFGIPNPDTGVARALRGSPEEAVRRYAIAIAIESMARVVASGGVLGSPAEIEAAIDAEERRVEERKQQQRKERGRKFWGGCLKGVLWFFGITTVIGLLGNLLRACSGDGRSRQSAAGYRKE